MMFIVIFGPPAVGKMSVGHELAKLTGLKLFHNHMTIDLVLNFFEFGNPHFGQLVSEFRTRVFEEVAKSDLPGLIFTYTWALNLESDKAFIDRSCEIFRQQGAEIYFVELEAELGERLKRNESEFRLAQKAPKRDIEKSKQLLLADEETHRMNSDGDFFYQENYLKLENTNLSANEAAEKIVETFGLPTAKQKPIRQYVTRAPAYEDYDPQSPIVAQWLSETITAVDPRLRVEHVGSSSVPGCGGKGYLDLMIIYPSGQLDLAKSVLHKLGFQRQGGRDPFPEERPMRVGCVAQGGRQYLIHAHVISSDSAEVDVMLGFRDQLRSDPALVRTYEEEKRAILKQGVLDGADYAEKKSKFVERTLAQPHDQAEKTDSP